jgi:hypothetical protein
MYRIWLGSLSLHCGWEVESETLRIPSTRNWAIIGVLPRYYWFFLIDISHSFEIRKETLVNHVPRRCVRKRY